MLAMYVAFFAWSLGRLDPVVAAPLAAVALGAVGWVTYHGLIRRVLAAPMLAQIFATFGLAVFLRNGAQFAFGVDFLTVQDPGWRAGSRSAGCSSAAAARGQPGRAHRLRGPLRFLSRSETGLALTATAQDRQAASLMGIDTQRMFALGWVIGGVGVAGALLAMFFYIYPDVGGPSLLAYVTVALGGFGNVPATLVAGVVVGLVEALAGLLIPPAFKYSVVFLLYLAVVLWRPQGLFGRF